MNLELFEKSCQENEDLILMELENQKGYKLFKLIRKYLYKHNYYYEEPSYHIFNQDGERVCIEYNYQKVIKKFLRLVERK